MSAQLLLSKLDKVKQTGRDTWRARCPAHGSKSLSLAIREMDDGLVVIKCHAECGAIEVLDAVGLDWSALYPARETGQHSMKPIRKPFSANDALAAMEFEGLVLLQLATIMESGTPLTAADRERLLLSINRIQNAREVTQ